MSNLELTALDREILASHCELCEGLSSFLGSAYEIVLHSLEDYEHSAIKVLNGFHTGRSEGAPITNLALSILEKIQQNPNRAMRYNYFSKNQYGKSMKSTTIPIYGRDERVIGLLCINLYLDTPFIDMVNGFLPDIPFFSGTNIPEIIPDPTAEEVYTQQADELISQTVQEIRTAVMDNPTITASNKTKTIIAELESAGIFRLKSAVVQCASLLGISKNTVYLHLRNLSKQG